MVESIPAPLNPLSLATAALSEEKLSNFYEVDDPFLKAQTQTDHQAQTVVLPQANTEYDADFAAESLYHDEELLTWLAELDSDSEAAAVPFLLDDVPLVKANSTGTTKQTQRSQVPASLQQQQQILQNQQLLPAEEGPPYKPLSSFIDSITAGWKQHAINTSTTLDSSSFPMAAATVASAYCVPFTVLDQHSSDQRGDRDGMDNRAHSPLPIAVADVAISLRTNSSAPGAGAGTNPEMFANELSFPPPSALKRIRSIDSQSSNSSNEKENGPKSGIHSRSGKPPLKDRCKEPSSKAIPGAFISGSCCRLPHSP